VTPTAGGWPRPGPLGFMVLVKALVGLHVGSRLPLWKCNEQVKLPVTVPRLPPASGPWLWKLQCWAGAARAVLLLWSEQRALRLGTPPGKEGVEVFPSFPRNWKLRTWQPQCWCPPLKQVCRGCMPPGHQQTGTGHTVHTPPPPNLKLLGTGSVGASARTGSRAQCAQGTESQTEWVV
jgi:hypothetical protein